MRPPDTDTLAPPRGPRARRAEPVVTVRTRAADFAALVLAVHEAGTARRPWPCGDIVDISPVRVHDAAPAALRRLHDLPATPAAALTLTRRGLAVDVAFQPGPHEAGASFHRSARGLDAGGGEPAAWIRCLAARTVETLAAEGITAVVETS